MIIETYPEMNAKIVGILRWGEDSPMLLYAAQRIEELEAEAKRLQRRYDSLRIRFDATQRVLTRTLNENRVRGECLSIALGRLQHTDRLNIFEIRAAVDEIERRLAQLEPGEEAR